MSSASYQRDDFIVLARALFDDHRRLLADTEAHCLNELSTLVDICCDSLSAGGKLLFFGNGGSAAAAQHLAAELTVRYLVDRPAISAIALTTDSSILTAAANDVSFEQIFSRQIEALGKAGDIAIGISTSGRSPNVLAGLRAAAERGLETARFNGAAESDMEELASPIIKVPSTDTPRIQEMHILLGHLLCHQIEARLS